MRLVIHHCCPWCVENLAISNNFYFLLSEHNREKIKKLRQRIVQFITSAISSILTSIPSDITRHYLCVHRKRCRHQNVVRGIPWEFAKLQTNQSIWKSNWINRLSRYWVGHKVFQQCWELIVCILWCKNINCIIYKVKFNFKSTQG